MRVAAFACLLVLTSCAPGGNADVAPEGDPAAPVRQDLRGRTYRAEAMAVADGAFVWAQNVVAGWRAAPAAISAVGDIPQAACAQPRPAEGTLVRHVHFERGVRAAPLYQFATADVDSRARFFVESYVASKGRAQGGGGYEAGDVVNVVDVAVTERSAPVALVLSA